MNTRMLHGTAAAVLYTVTAAAVGVLQLRLALQYMPAGMAGVWTLFVTCGTYIALFDLGLTPTVGRQVSLLVGAGQGGVAGLLRTTSVAARYLAAGVWVVSAAAGWAMLGGGRVTTAWMVFSAGAAANLLGGPAYAGLFGLGRVAEEKVIRSIALAAGLVMTAMFLRAGWGITGAAVAWALQGLLGRGLAGARLRMVVGRETLRGAALDWARVRELAGPSLKLAGIQVASVAILQSANPVIARQIGTAAIPSYESVSRIALTMMTFALLVASNATPFVAMAYAAGDVAGVRRLLERNVRVGMAMMIVPCSFVAVFGDKLVGLWLGAGVFPGFAVLWVLLAVVLLEVHHVIYASAVMATGRVVFVPAAALASVLTLGLAFALAPRLGLFGVALGALIAQMLTNNWYAPYRAFKLFGMPAGDTLRRLALPCVMLLGAQLVLAVCLRRAGVFEAGTMLGLVANLLVVGGVGAVLSCMLCLDGNEREVLSAMLRRRAARA